MNIFFKHKITFPVSLVCVLLFLVGCSQDMLPEQPEAEDDALMVSFRVVSPKVNANQLKSRASWEDNYVSDSGTDFDNALLSDDIQVFITDNRCEKVETVVTMLYCAKLSESEESVEYDFLGVIDKEALSSLKELENGKIHVFANVDKNKKLLDDPIFELWGQPSTSFNAIPMWGVKTVDNFSSIKTGDRFNAGEIHLLRSMAKIEVINESSSDNYISGIRNVKVSMHSANGYVLPTGWNTCVDTKSIGYNNIRIPQDGILIYNWNSTISGNFDSNETQGDRVVFYLPESKNFENDEITLTVAYDTKSYADMPSENLSNVILFRPYQGGKPNGSPFDISRNHLYRFTIKKPSPSSLEVEVEDYQVVDLEPGFGIPALEEEEQNP